MPMLISTDYYLSHKSLRERFIFMKEQIVLILLEHIKQELATLLTAANNAHLAAIDDQSVAETQYDTLAIEASYLAQGQSRRVQELQAALKAIQALVLNTSEPINMGSLVQLASDIHQDHWFFIAPAAAGFRCEIEQHKITIITPLSPLGKALIGKYCHDEITLMLGNNRRVDEIVAVM